MTQTLKEKQESSMYSAHKLIYYSYTPVLCSSLGLKGRQTEYRKPCQVPPCGENREEAAGRGFEPTCEARGPATVVGEPSARQRCRCHFRAHEGKTRAGNDLIARRPARQDASHLRGKRGRRLLRAFIRRVQWMGSRECC